MNINWLEEAQHIASQIIADRQYLHAHAEIGFDLTKTRDYVENRLIEMGYSPQRIGKCGITAELHDSPRKKTVLLRSDMDALPIREETSLPYRCTTGAMHACGHDMHTAILLGAAQLLIKHRHKISVQVRFLFQAAEETLEGAKDAIAAGILKSPKPDIAIMIHVLTATQLPTGTIVVAAPGVSAPAADFFEITVKGRGCHGSTPEKGVDALSVAARIVLGLQNLPARELAAGEASVLTVGSMTSGNSANVISDLTTIGGTLRSFSEETRAFMKNRLEEIAKNIANAFRAEATVTFTSGCPTLTNDPVVVRKTLDALTNTPGLQVLSAETLGSKGGGSEDFAYISHEIPSVMLALSAGSAAEGFTYPLHHPMATFNEESLSVGSAVLARLAEEFAIR